MEEAIALFAGAIAIGAVVFLADLIGLVLGYGWGHYSRKLQNRKREEKERIERFK